MFLQFVGAKSSVWGNCYVFVGFFCVFYWHCLRNNTLIPYVRFSLTGGVQICLINWVQYSCEIFVFSNYFYINFLKFSISYILDTSKQGCFLFHIHWIHITWGVCCNSRNIIEIDMNFRWEKCPHLVFVKAPNKNCLSMRLPLGNQKKF